ILPVVGSISTREAPALLPARTARASSRSRKRLRVRGGRGGVVCLRLDICPESAHLERRVSSPQFSASVSQCRFACYCTALLGSNLQTDRRAQLSTKYFLRSAFLALASGGRPLPPPTSACGLVSLPSCQELLHARADGGLLVDPGADVLAVERSQHVVGTHDLGEPGAPSPLPLGWRHHVRGDARAAHAANSRIRLK